MESRDDDGSGSPDENSRLRREHFRAAASMPVPQAGNSDIQVPLSFRASGMTSQPLRPAPWTRRPQPINTHALRPDEFVTDTTFLTPPPDSNGVTLNRTLISPRWPQTFVLASVAGAVAHSIQALPATERRTFLTPKGRITCTRRALLGFELGQPGFGPFYSVWVYVLEDEAHGYLGVNMIIGRRCN
jgi:hypothetical protein